jgi:TPR repeat protein
MTLYDPNREIHVTHIDPTVRKHIENEEFEQAFDILLPQAEQGNPDTQFLLGYLHFTSAEIDPHQAKEWLRKAAARNHAEACYYLARWLDDNHTGMPSDPEGMELFHRAAELGSSGAQCDLASSYAMGWNNFPVDAALSRGWYLRAAEQGVVDAQYNLGMMLLTGEGGNVDYKRGIEWLVRTASRDVPAAMSTYAARVLAEANENGLYGVERNGEIAGAWRQREEELEQGTFRSHPDWFY